MRSSRFRKWTKSERIFDVLIDPPYKMTALPPLGAGFLCTLKAFTKLSLPMDNTLVIHVSEEPRGRWRITAGRNKEAH